MRRWRFSSDDSARHSLPPFRHSAVWTHRDRGRCDISADAAAQPRAGAHISWLRMQVCLMLTQLLWYLLKSGQRRKMKPWKRNTFFIFGLSELLIHSSSLLSLKPEPTTQTWAFQLKLLVWTCLGEFVGVIQKWKTPHINSYIISHIISFKWIKSVSIRAPLGFFNINKD